MKIIELRCENIKKLVAVAIRPDGNLVEITGKNGQGKTSVLDAIWWALEGQRNIQAVPIRKGETTARIQLDLGELKITRTFAQAKDKDKNPTGEYTTSIVVENADGARFPSPQSVIDKLLGALSFDPLAFTRMKPEAQLETLKAFVPGIDFAAIDRENDRDFKARTDLNRQAKELRAREAGMVVTKPAGQLVDESALAQELEGAGKHNLQLAGLEKDKTTGYQEVKRLKALVKEKESRRDRLADELAALTHEITQLLDTAAVVQRDSDAIEIAAPIDTARIRGLLDHARQNNQAIRDADRALKQREEIHAQADDAEKRAAALTNAMEARKKQKSDAIAAAKLPIEGIGFGENGVLLNGVPFEQASDAEQLRASIGIAAAMNPKLRVIRVRDGSLLDDDAMKLLAEFAQANDLQVWIERVDSSGKVGFVMEDGHVRETVTA